MSVSFEVARQGNGVIGMSKFVRILNQNITLGFVSPILKSYPAYSFEACEVRERAISSVY